jgi:zinc ribbon protein
MFIIFGTKMVKTPVKNGLILRKHCARCHFLSDMREHSFRQYFTLFFIPVFPTSKGESILVCNRCDASFYIQAEDYLAADKESPFNSAGATQKDLGPGAEGTVIVCDYCRGRLRIPMTGRRLLVTCPHCKRKFEI